MGARAVDQICVLGKNGTGKTTFLRKEVIEPVIKAARRVLIVTPHYNEWEEVEEIEPTARLLRKNGFKGVRKIVYTTEELTLHPISNYYFDGILILDDCKFYLPNQTSMILQRIFIARRQFMRDVFLVAHGFSQIPPTYFTFNTKYVLFATSDKVEVRKSKISNYEEVAKVKERVDRKAKKNPHYKEMITV